MNSKHLLVWATAASLLCVPALAQKNKSKSKIPTLPAGILSATPQVVQTGTYPTLSWYIAYPSSVGDVAVVTPPASIELTEPNTYVDVRAVGIGVTEAVPSGSKESIPAELRISVDGSNYSQLIYGNNSVVDPTHSLFTKKVNKGTTINFGGRYVKDGAWTEFYTGKNPNFQIVALADGDKIPTSFDLQQSGKMAEYVKPYVNSDGTVKVGPMSLLVMAEFGGSDRNHSSFDYQDAVFLMNFSPKNNNGHGNNIDGVDSSNPGGGSGGPNGAVDPSGNIDDEK